MDQELIVSMLQFLGVWLFTSASRSSLKHVQSQRKALMFTAQVLMPVLNVVSKVTLIAAAVCFIRLVFQQAAMG